MGSGLHHLFLRDTAVVVAFHRVNRILADDGLTCDVELFEQFCRLFANYFDVISLGSLVERLEIGAPLDRELAITFDDGYQDNYQYAAPLLKALGLPATFFVVTQFVGTEVVPWWDRDLNVAQAWMSWDQVRWLHKEGFEIGSHTRTHANLWEVVGDKAWEEIVGSRMELEEEISARVDLFAYPYGGEEGMREENRKIVKAAGLRCCCSCYGGINMNRTDPFHLRRIPISSWYESPYQFACDVALRID